MFRWLVGVSYRVSFGSDPVANAGGGMFGSFAAVAGAIHLDEGGDMETQESWMNHPFWADKKDHCVLRYKKALCRQINKQLATQEQICKLFPCPTDACSLRVRPANTHGSTLRCINQRCCIHSSSSMCLAAAASLWAGQAAGPLQVLILASACCPICYVHVYLHT